MSIEIIGARYWTHGSGHIIRPASKLDEERLAALPEGRSVAIVITTADAPKMRQFYFGMITRLVQAGVWEHTDEADLDLMVRVGRVDRVTIRVDDTGKTVRYTPVSKVGWSIPEWRDYLAAVVPVVISEVLPKVGWAKTRQDIEQYCGVRLAEAIAE